MRSKNYNIMANETARDVVENNDIILKSNLSLDEAWPLSISLQKTGDFVAVWIEEAEKPKTPRITRSIEQDHKGIKLEVVRCDGWMV